MSIEQGRLAILQANPKTTPRNQMLIKGDFVGAYAALGLQTIPGLSAIATKQVRAQEKQACTCVRNAMTELGNEKGQMVDGCFRFLGQALLGSMPHMPQSDAYKRF